VIFWLFFFLFPVAWGFAAPALADDYEGPSGYGATGTTYELDVSHDGYGRGASASETADPTKYVVVDAESGVTEEIEGETVVVVQEPEPIAASAEAPPPPQVVVVEEQIPPCPGGVWVDGYWYYGNGEYLWVDGHCTAVQVNYVFVHPRWDFYADIWWFVPGYYRPCGVYVGFGYYRPWYWYPPYYHPYYPAHRPVAVQRSAARRPTTAYPARAPRTRSSVARAPGRPTTVIDRAPRATTRSRSDTGIVSQPRVNTSRAGRGIGRGPSSAGSSGFSISRSRNRPSSTGTTTVRQPRSGSGTRGGWRSGGTRSTPSGGRSGGRGSSGSPSRGGFGGSRSAPSPRSR